MSEQKTRKCEMDMGQGPDFRTKYCGKEYPDNGKRFCPECLDRLNKYIARNEGRMP